MTENKSLKHVYFHVGLPKTASTFFQRNVFPEFKDIHYIKKHDVKYKDEIIQKSDATKFLLSKEIDPEKESGLKKIKDVADKYSGASPILVLRKHASWLRSKYKYYIRKHGYKNFHDFFDLENDQGIVKKENLDYLHKIKILEQTYQKSPFIIFQEELRNNPFGVIDELASYLNISYNKNDIKIKDVKRSYSEKQLKLVKKFNAFYKYDHSKIKHPFAKFFYKKTGGLFLHSVAYFALLLPDFLFDNKPLIPQSTMKRINDLYKEDWDECVDYAKKTRKQLFL